MDLVYDIVDELSKEIAGERELIGNMIYVLGSKFILNKNPLSFHTVLNSESGSGKDFIMTKIIRIFEPFQDYEIYTRISERALDYLHANEVDFTWNNKFLVLHDVDENILNSSTMKLFMTEGSNTAIVDNGIVKVKRIKGRPVILMTTAYSNPNLEQLRRVNIMNLDESDEQTTRIMNFQSFRSQNEKEYTNMIDYKKIGSILSNLKPCYVKIPFAEHLVDKISCKNIHLRTFFPKILDFIKSSAALNQLERKVENGCILADVIDYENIRYIINSFSHGTTFRPLSIARRELLEMIKDNFDYNEFTIRDIASYSGKSYNSVRLLLKNLIEEKYIDCERVKDDWSSKFVLKYRLRRFEKIKLPSLLVN